jgi:hypothetical protein
VVEYSSTSIVPPDDDCHVDGLLNLIILPRERSR